MKFRKAPFIAVLLSLIFIVSGCKFFKGSTSRLDPIDKELLQQSQTIDPIDKNVLTCRYRTKYGQFYQTTALDSKGNPVVYPEANKAHLFTWECPDLLYPPNFPQSCPDSLKKTNDTPIYADLFLIINDLPPKSKEKSTPHVIRKEFISNSIQSCQEFTPHPEMDFVEFGFRSQNDRQPYLFHRPFFMNTPKKILDDDFPFSRIVVFGDTTADNGAMWDLTEHSFWQWPYFFGISNGLIWTHYLEKNINSKNKDKDPIMLYNYATGSIEIFFSTLEGVKSYYKEQDVNRLSYLTIETDRYVNTIKTAQKLNKNFDPGYNKTLYIISDGIDNYHYFAKPEMQKSLKYCGKNLSFSSPLTPEICAKTVVYGAKDVPPLFQIGIKGNINKIIKIAGNETKEMFFLIPLLYDLTLDPYYNFSHIPPIAPILSIAFINMAYKKHNQYLLEAIEELKKEHPDKKLNFIILDMEKIVNGIINDEEGPYYEIAKKAQLRNKTRECYESPGWNTKPSLNFCFNPAEHVFWDYDYFSMTMDCIIAHQMTEKLYETFLPNTKYKPDYAECHQSYVNRPLSSSSPF